MQLLQLRIKNLNSLKGEHSIDFEKGPIGNTGLFAITGPTGAGKSTILDAITLALYNQTPRSGAVSKNDIARLGSIITRNTDEAWAQLDYRAHNAIYRSQWGISRNRNGNLRDYTLVLSKQEDDGQFISVVDKRNEVPKENARIIGLNFDQFLRSILLSQGDFARFLKSNANERGELLEKITGTEIYRQLGRACYERRGKELKELEYLKIQLEGIEILSEEECKQLKDELKLLNKNSKISEEKITQLRKHLQTMQEHNQLSVSIEKSKEQLTQLNTEMEAFKSDKERLEKHHNVLPLKAEILAVEQGRNSIREKQKEETEKNKQLQHENASTELTQKQLVELERKVDDFNKKQEETKLLIKKVRDLDSEIKVAQNSYQSLEEQNLSMGKQVDALHVEIKSLEENLVEKEKELSAIKNFLEKNKQLNGVGEQLPLLEQQVQTIVLNTQSFNESIGQLETSPTKTAISEALDNDKRLNVIQNAVQQSERFIQDKQEQLPKDMPDIDGLKQQHKELQELGFSLERLLDVCKENNKVNEEKATLTKELDINAKAIEVKEKEQEAVGQALKINQKYLDELNIRRERELLEAKYEEARQLLKPDEACPLCGSLQHPYVSNYETRKDETEEKLKAKNAERKELLELEKQTIEQVSKHKSTLKSLKNQLDINANKLKEYKSQIQQTADKCALKAENVSEGSLADTMEAHQNKQKQVEQQIITLEKLDKAIVRNKEYAKLSGDLSNLIQLQLQVEGSLKDFGANSDRSLSVKLEALKNNHAIYAQRQEQLQVEEKEYSAKSIAWKEKGKQLQELMQAYARLNKELGTSKQKLTQKKENREAVFGTRTPEVVETELENEKGKLNETRKALEIKLQKSTVLSKALSERLLELKNELQEEQVKLLSQTDELNKQLNKKGLESVESALGLLLTEDEVKQLQQQEEKYVKMFTELNHSIKEQSDKLDQLNEVVKNIPHSEAELKLSIDEQELQLKTNLGRAGSLQQKIKTDTQNKEKQKEKVQLIDKQQKNFQRWDELSSLIGDATGNKFSRFAQELTLKQVLQLANNHLKVLSDRYVVKHVKNETTDELFVMDMYHGNAERSVKTLSGGESFLVSLSLALGLSDLAGQNTVIGSLFIDEGFGTLDQNTLDVALSALEKLQSETNRTIGIISHVPALKERVTTQIELRKDASGYSKLEVRS